ncbi:MAG TPA: ornithine carbamoyltransferase [Candidatus Thalassarchaeaceae archaeon]|nr:ornithine carbamoyltransferase [Candidatus Thalassarchaeaceae archaeon]|tara:strand:+ start:447 stop:1403 length:957 start_codon:yes stop_codon:yes gene_type:complete
MKGIEARRLLSIDDIDDELREMIDWAIRIKNDDGSILDFKPLDGMAVGSIYEKPSTRTRVSFEVGISRLGGKSLTLLSGDLQLGKSETVADTASVLSRYLDCITFRCFEHEKVEELAENATVPVINALSDIHHPCQAAADMMTIVENGGVGNGHIAWIGDGNNVLHDLVLGAAIMGFDIKYATPKGFEPSESVIERAKSIADANGVSIVGTNDPKEAVIGASVIYTDVFISMGEEHMGEKIDSFDGFQVNEELVSNAREDFIFMHCLPAHRGDEVTDAVLDSPNSVVWDQAENRMWAQMSILTNFCNETAWQAYWDLR